MHKRSHQDRQAITAELHARPIDLVRPVAIVRRLVFVPPAAQRSVDMIGQRFAAFATERDMAVPTGSRQFTFDVGEKSATWEFHTEFVTVTWRASPADDDHYPDNIGLHLLEDADLIAATVIDVTTDSMVSDKDLASFSDSSLCVSGVEDGAGEVATDFVADDEGYTHFVFAAGTMLPNRRSALVRRLLEVDTYRSMALLGLPLARRSGGALSEIEAEVGALMSRLPGATSTERIQAALSVLHDISNRTGHLTEQLGYRFGASKAYADILAARIESLHEVQTGRGLSLGRYLVNRVGPAIDTCKAMSKRHKAVASKTYRAIELLNLRIGLDIQIQNQNVLDTIAATSRSQFRLQRTVEGLSVFAISYYLIGVIGVVAAGPLELLAIDKAIALSVVAPVAVIVVWFFIRLARREPAV